MNEHEARIQELVSTPPKFERTRWQKIGRVVSIVCNVAAIVSIIAVVVVSVQNSNLANCTNSNLGARNVPNVDDRIATDNLFRTQKNELKILADPTEPLATKRLAFAAYLSAFDTYQKTRARDDKIRANNPIGQC